MCLQLQEGKKGEAAYLFNWDGSTAPDAVRAALQAFFLFVWVTPFPRLQSKNKVSIWVRAVARGSAGLPFPRRFLRSHTQKPWTTQAQAHTSPKSGLLNTSLPPTHHFTENSPNFAPYFSSAKFPFNSFFTELKIQSVETNGPYRKVTPNRKALSGAAANPAEEKRPPCGLLGEPTT